MFTPGFDFGKAYQQELLRQVWSELVAGDGSRSVGQPFTRSNWDRFLVAFGDALIRMGQKIKNESTLVPARTISYDQPNRSAKPC